MQVDLLAADLVAVAILGFGLYFPRYRRRDVLVAIVGLNIGVLAVVTALQSADVSLALGFGLFGILSIIRLRSSELDQEEIAYYFSSLAIGLLGGTDVEPAWTSPTLMIAILVALFVVDHPRLFARNRRQLLTLDRAFTNETELANHLEELLGGTVQRLKVRRVDLINDSTVVDVRFRLPA